MGKYIINLPTMPGQNASGKNGAMVVSVPVKIGRNTSPAAIFAASIILKLSPFPSRKILCVFSTTTIASSTTIPSAKMKANITSMFIVNPICGSMIYAKAILNGTDSPTNIALVMPIKNINTKTTKINPIIIVLLSSFKVLRVKRDISPV